MKETTNLQQMAGKVFQAMNTRDFSDFERIITDDVAFDFPGAGRVEGSRRTLLHFRGGKISFISDYFKDTSFTGPSK